MRWRPDQIALGAATVVGAAVLYLLFVGQAGLNESIAAAVVTVLAALFGYGLFRTTPWSLVLHANALGALMSAAASIPGDTWAVGRVLLRAIVARPDHPMGRVDRQPFGRGRDPEEAGARAVAGLAASLAPNGYLVDVEEDGQALIHRLAPQKGSA